MIAKSDHQSFTVNMIPNLFYRDPAAAVEWLCKAFKFKKSQIYKDDKGSVVHAELTFGNGMIMLGPISNTAFGRHIKHPDELGGAETQCCYVIVDDADAHCAEAKAAGAKIVLEPTTKDYGGRDYTCRDLEGHLWSFGTYDPWKKL